MNMMKKARRFANAKIFACHLISVKTTMMWNFIKSNEKNIFMLNNSFQSIHDVFLYRVEHDKKSLTVNLLYEFARTMNEKISKNFIVVVIKKMTTIIIKLQKELKKRAHRQNQTTKKLTTLQTSHQCERYNYVNFTRYCWKDLNIDQHYVLISHHFVCWNKILDNEILSVDFKIFSLNVKKNLISLTKKKDKKIDSQSSFSSSIMTFSQIHFSAYAFSFAISFAASFTSYSASVKVLNMTTAWVRQ
jgi:hypothetical protein